MKQFNLPQILELDSSYRYSIIQSLGTQVLDLEDKVLEKIQGLPAVILKDVISILEYGYRNPEFIPGIRYELEEYSNDLDPKFCEQFLDENKGKIVRVLDLGAGPGDVTLRGYQQLVDAGLQPQVFALESSSKFRKNILDNATMLDLPSEELIEIPGNNISSGVYPVVGNIQQLGLQNLENLDLITGNYVLDRVPQVSLMNILQQSGPRNIQFTNCVPLQYQNPNTGQSYIPDSEIIIPEGATDLSAVATSLGMKNVTKFDGKNTVTSLQDGQENFDYAGIRGKL